MTSVSMFSGKMLYSDALIGQQSSSVKYYRKKSSIYPHLKSLYTKALRISGEDFITEKIAKTVVRTYYKSHLQESGVSDPIAVSEAAADFATMYNITKAHAMKVSFKLPDLTTLTEIIEWIGKYVRKFIRGSLTIATGIGIIVTIGLGITGGLLAAMPAIIATSAVVLGYVYSEGMIVITRDMWKDIKDFMRAIGLLDRDARIRKLVRNTETYESYNEVVKIFEKYKGKEMPPNKVAEAKRLIEYANADAKEFMSLVKSFEKDLKVAEKELKKRK